MYTYNSYLIKETERFTPEQFPEVTAELQVFFEAIHGFSSPDKEYIVISYLKHHSLHSAWVQQYPQLTDIITRSHFPTAHIESLYASAGKNLAFIDSFEDYIRNHL